MKIQSKNNSVFHIFTVIYNLLIKDVGVYPVFHSIGSQMNPIKRKAVANKSQPPYNQSRIIRVEIKGYCSSDRFRKQGKLFYAVTGYSLLP